MTKAKIVIGANYGDEGKGLVTAFFAEETPSICVLHNGGAQRGHTVDHRSGERYVFHHFGSGFFYAADTFFAKQFIINPMIFFKEYSDLEKKYRNAFPNARVLFPKNFVHPECRISLPHDLVFNQILEDYRSEGRHGSCGVGIRETQIRDGFTRFNVGMAYHIKDKVQLLPIFAQTHDYYINRFAELQLPVELVEKFSEIVDDENIFYNYFDDLTFFKAKCSVATDNIITNYPQVIFEGGQGLLLDQNNLRFFPHLTPSNTGVINPVGIINELGKDNFDTEIVYVSRTFATRHGAGPMVGTELPKEWIGDVVDKTNEPNPYQGILRYGALSPTDMKFTIDNDLRFNNIKARYSLALTHMNETDNKVVCMNEAGEVIKTDWQDFVNLAFDARKLCRVLMSHSKSRVEQ
jgi:adenylosuccinate synthase